MKASLLFSIAGLLVIAGSAFGSAVQIQLAPQTSVSVADQRSTITIAATLYKNGSLVPDGTQVVFSSSAGTFRDSIVTTNQGRALAVLVAPATPGTATVTATALDGVSTTEIEFFSNRSLLNSANEYIEVYAPGYLSYGTETKTMSASAPDKGIHLRYREVEIDADDLQLDVRNYEVRAKRAHVKMGRQDFETTDLYLKLNSRKGYAYGHFTGPTVTAVTPYGPWFKPTIEQKDHFGLVSVSLSGLKAPEPGPSEEEIFTFHSVSDEDTTLIQAKKAVAFPHKEVQFQEATLMVGGAKAMKLPLYRDPMYASGSVTDQIVSVNDNHLTVNYPYYLSLKPGQSSLLRFRTGQTYGRGIGANNRVSLDYELAWNKGDNMDGGFTFSGIARKDWNVSLRQYLRLRDDTTLAANIEMPASRALFGSVSANKQFSGFGISLVGTANQTLQGPKFESKSLALDLESDGIKAGKLPIRLFWGFTANEQQSFNDVTGRVSQNGAGATLRGQLLQQRLDKNTNLSAGLRLFGNMVGTEQRFEETGSVTLSRAINTHANVILTYNYNNDGFNSRLIGQHSLNLNANMDWGHFHFSGYALRSLDADRFTYFFDSGYRFASRWSLLYSHTFSEFMGERSLEYYPTLAYDIGGRQIGLTWSNRTKRFGIQLLGSSFN